MTQEKRSNVVLRESDVQDVPSGVEMLDFLTLSGFKHPENPALENKRQLEAWEAIFHYPYVLYGGAAAGGKSHFLRWAAIGLLLYYAQQYGLRKVRIGLFCEDYPALYERQEVKIQMEFPEWLGKYNMSRHEFVLNPQFGGGVLTLLNLDDPTKYKSAEFAAIFVDELTENKREVFDALIWRLRWKGIGDTKFIAASNPGGPGHGWVKKLWIDKNYDGERFDGRKFKYVRARYTDNPHNHANYGETLDMLPDDKREAYKNGSWDVFAGQYFTEFNRDAHVIEPFEMQDMRDEGNAMTIELFKNLPLYAGMDYGYTNPSAVLFGKYFDGVWYIFHEIYEKKLTYPLLMERVLRYGNPYMVFADPAIWAKKDDPTSGADQMKSLTLRKAMNSREIGWTILREYFRANRIKIYDTCTNLIRTIPDMVHHKTKVEDLDTSGEDHALDALRYLIVSHKLFVLQEDILTYAKPGQKVEPQSDSDLDEVFQEEGGDQYTQLSASGFILPRYH